jgi:hypothetical protein
LRRRCRGFPADPVFSIIQDYPNHSRLFKIIYRQPAIISASKNVDLPDRPAPAVWPAEL